MFNYIQTAMQHSHIAKRYSDYEEWTRDLAKQRWNYKTGKLKINGNTHAFVYNSAWVVVCPYCPEQMYAEPDELFFCSNCLMHANKHRAVRIIFPAIRVEIEALLNMRPLPENRNWLLVETVNDLLQENIKHGVI